MSLSCLSSWRAWCLACLASSIVMACESKPVEAPRQDMAPAPVVMEEVTRKEPPREDDDVFLTGTPEQRDMLVAMRTLVLSEPDDAKAVKVLSELFYSKPESLVQLGAGAELARLLFELEQREAAENVLDDLESAEVDPAYGAMLWVRAARIRVEMSQNDRALALYDRVLEQRPDYGFVLAEVAKIPGTDAGIEERYQAWRAARIEEIGSGEAARSKALDLLLMAQYDPEVERALRGLLDGEAGLDERTSARITMWLGTHGTKESGEQAGGDDDEAK